MKTFWTGLLLAASPSAWAAAGTAGVAGMLLSLLLILGLFVLAAWLFKRYLPQAGKSGPVRLVGATMVGPRERVVVLDRGHVAFDGPVSDGLLFYHRMLGTEEKGSEALRPAARRGPLAVAELELRDADDRRRHMFRPGEALAVDLVVQAAEPQERALVALEVRDPRGETIFRTDASIGAVAGERRVRFEIPRLALLGGDYEFTEPDDVAELADGADLELAGLRFVVDHTPGHTAGSVTFRTPWDQPDGPDISEVMFSGDLLFAGSIGRTDLPGGDHPTMLRSLRDRVLTLPDDIVVLPGHGEQTSIGRERATNPFLLDLIDTPAPNRGL